MKKLLMAGVAVAMAGFLSFGAQAAPTAPATTVGQDITASGTPVTAAYLFFDAGDDSDLDVRLNMNGSTQFLFSNREVNASAIGATALINNVAIGDLLTFILSNVTQGTNFSTGVASTNVAYISTGSAAVVEASLGITLSAAAQASLAGLAAIGNVTVVAFEDRTSPPGDGDFNDLVFAFAQTSTSVPEPASMALFGAGLLGLGLARRARRKSA